MLHRTDSEIELSTRTNINKIIASLISLMVIPDRSPPSFDKDFLKSVNTSLDKMINDAMKANITALNKNPENRRLLEEHWNQYDKQEVQCEDSLSTLSIKAF